MTLRPITTISRLSEITMMPAIRLTAQVSSVVRSLEYLPYF